MLTVMAVSGTAGSRSIVFSLSKVFNQAGYVASEQLARDLYKR
jgi:hypothetical protein